MTKIGIYSGTFDPVHTGHVAFANAALRECKLDKIFFLVEPRPRRKQGVKAFEHRTEMVKLAIRDQSNLGSIVLNQQRFTPTDTLPLLTERFKSAELYMIMGDDMLDHLAGWPHVEYLIRTVTFIISVRESDEKKIQKTLKDLQQTRGIKLRYQIIANNLPEISSSKIKQAIRNGKEPKGLARPVLNYIKKNGLYVSAKAE